MQIHSDLLTHPCLSLGRCPSSAYACNPTLSSRYRETSSGDGAFIKAQLDIGGPWVPGMGDTPQEYRDGGGAVEVAGLDAQTLVPVEKDIHAAGAMTVSIRQVTMPPETRMDCRTITADPAEADVIAALQGFSYICPT